MPQQISATRLIEFAQAAYRKLGVPSEDAALLADTLVQADLWDHQSHGVMRTFWYADRLQTGATKAITRIDTVTDAGGLAVLDGNDGIGQVIAARAMRSAITRAKAHGIGAVAVRNSGHFGTAMYFTRMAASEGCIGFLSTNASPAMAPWGGRTKAVGNNPWSLAAPAGRHTPMVLDIANTAVARGKLYLAKQRGERIPEGWAVDEAGRPTTDAAEGIAGNILPMAGHKGYAISVMMDVLSGVLGASSFGTAVTGPYIADQRSGVGHFAFAIDIAACRPMAEFEADMEQMISGLKSAPLAEGETEIFYPGEREARADAINRRDGLLIPDETLDELNRKASKLGIPCLT